jgi:phosphatidyl-myo-inositol alpha-mannosyltransferase
MKIGLICPYSIVKGGGVQEIVRAQQAELRRRGHDAWIVTPRPQNHADEPGNHTIFIGTSFDVKSPTRTTFQVSASDSEAIEAMLEREQFDILHFHEPWIPMLSPQLLARSRSANVATFHAKMPENMMTRTAAKVAVPYTKPILKYIDMLTAVSEAAAENVCALTDEPVAIVPNGIDLARFKPPKTFNDTAKAKTILYVGRLEGRKGVKYLLHAFRLLQARQPSVALQLVGDGPDRDKLEMLADDLELLNVTFLGFVSEADKVRYLRTSDLFCSPAVYGESFGVVLLEAMASGLVTVAGDNPGYASVMNGLGAVSLVNPKYTEDFARRLELLLFQPVLRDAWRAWAAKETPQYSWERVVNQYEEVYKEALKRHKRRHG